MWLLALIAGLVIGLVGGLLVKRRPSARPSARPQELSNDAPAALSIDSSAELARLRVAIDALPVGVVLADASGTVVFRNTVSEQIAGSRHGAVLVDEAVDALITQAIEGRADHRSLEVFGPPRRVLLLGADPLDGGGGGALVTIADATDRTRLDAVRTDFVANVSHELKTPVGAMTVLAETIADADDPEVIERLAGRIVEEAERLSRTVDDLLELSRIELGGQAVAEPVDVDAAIDEALGRVRALADQRQIHLLAIDVAGDLKVLGDRRQLVSAVGNLVENAVKYSERDGSVEVRAGEDCGWALISVVDHGIGIPVRDLERVFERFYRVDRARSRGTGGTGLGLSIVRHVAANHGGEVSVTSVEGEGSTFVLRIPAVGKVASDARLSVRSSGAVNELP